MSTIAQLDGLLDLLAEALMRRLADQEQVDHPRRSVLPVGHDRVEEVTLLCDKTTAPCEDDGQDS